jgi:antitoxin VapB
MRTTKTFKSGNSVAVRLPATLGVKAGVEMRVREEQGAYLLEPVEAPKRKLDVSKFWGKAPGLEPLPRESRSFEKRPSARSASSSDEGE